MLLGIGVWRVLKRVLGAAHCILRVHLTSAGSSLSQNWFQVLVVNF